MRCSKVRKDCDIKMWVGNGKCWKKTTRKMRIRMSPLPYSGRIVCPPSLRLQASREDKNASLIRGKIVGIESHIRRGK